MDLASPGRSLPGALPHLTPRWLHVRVEVLPLACSLYLVLGQNLSFWTQVFRALPSLRDAGTVPLLIALFAGLTTLFLLLTTLLSARAVVKPALTIVLIAAAACSHFLDGYGVVIDDGMIVNLLQTSRSESGQLLGPSLFLHVLFTGVLPALVLWQAAIVPRTRWPDLLHRVLPIAIGLAVLGAAVAVDLPRLRTWLPAHRDLRFYVNPTYPLWSAIHHGIGTWVHRHAPPPTSIAADATRTPLASGKPRAVVLVVGGMARAASFGLDGYARQTTPELAARADVINFRHVTACGTETSIAMPCMFSRLGRDHFSRRRARGEENLLDVLARTGVSVQWRDNDSDCKGVCARVASEDLRTARSERLCDATSCYDEILLRGLDDWLDAPGGDRLLVLHLMGGHGPSYFRRFPPAYRRFAPDCAQDDVQACSRETIVNAYDDTIVYTDHVLASAIATLERHRPLVEPALVYVSDHGESLGESGIYLHGLPYELAPAVQKEVPLVAWSPRLDVDCLRGRADGSWSQDNLFPTVLGLFGVATAEYRPQADLLRGCSRPL